MDGGTSMTQHVKSLLSRLETIAGKTVANSRNRQLTEP